MQQEDLEQFGIEVEPLRDAVRVCPSGELDVATVGALREQVEDLIAAGFERLVLDLGELAFLDSSGIHLVLDLVLSDEAVALTHWRPARPRPALTRLALLVPRSSSGCRRRSR